LKKPFSCLRARIEQEKSKIKKIPTGLFFTESSLTTNMESKIATSHQVHDKEEIFPVLESIKHIYQKPIKIKFSQRWREGLYLRMLEFAQQMSLIHDGVDTPLCDDPYGRFKNYSLIHFVLGFRHFLHGKKLTSFFRLNSPDLKTWL